MRDLFALIVLLITCCSSSYKVEYINLLEQRMNLLSYKNKLLYSDLLMNCYEIQNRQEAIDDYRNLICSGDSFIKNNYNGYSESFWDLTKIDIKREIQKNKIIQDSLKDINNLIIISHKEGLYELREIENRTRVINETKINWKSEIEIEKRELQNLQNWIKNKNEEIELRIHEFEKN